MTAALLALDARALGEAFRRFDASPVAYMTTCLERIHRLNEHLCVFNNLECSSRLLQQAEAAEARYRRGAPCSSLDGVPFAAKANIAIAGLPWHAGVSALAGRRARADAEAVARLRKAGMIPLGIVNMHEAALGVTSNNPAFGRTLNPHNPAHIAGGSSGGSAAAVAAGMVPIALGTDDLGSVRLPSALCGIIGYKPAHGVIPTGGLIPLSAQLDHIGVHARSLADVRLVMHVFGESHGDLEPDRGQAGERSPSLASLRLAADFRIDAVIEAACTHQLERLGCEQTIDWRDIDLSAWRRAGLLVCVRDAERTFAELLDSCPQGFGQEFRALVDWARSKEASRFERAEDLIRCAGERVRRDLQGRVLLCPTTPVAAPGIHEQAPHELPNLTLPANFAGVPSISVPMPDARSSLPVGMLITGLEASHVLAVAEASSPDALAPATFPDEGRQTP